MPDTKQLRNRIRSVNSTLHLTHAMELVASSKIRRAMEKKERSGDYAGAAARAMGILAGCRAVENSPWLKAREGERTRLIVIAGDRGLAGGYNANVFRLARQYPQAQVVPVGKRACDRYGGPFIGAESFTAADAERLAADLCRDYREEKYDRLGILYTRYVSMMEQVAEIRWVLPVPEELLQGGTADMLFEPGEGQILSAAVPLYVAGMIAASVRESFACEVNARRTAMDAAGKNARTMIDELQLQYNRARQGAITQEITEIVAGGNA